MYTTYCYLSTCGPRTSPRQRLWPCAIKGWMPALHPFMGELLRARHVRNKKLQKYSYQLCHACLFTLTGQEKIQLVFMELHTVVFCWHWDNTARHACVSAHTHTHIQPSSPRRLSEGKLFRKVIYTFEVQNAFYVSSAGCEIIKRYFSAIER